MTAAYIPAEDILNPAPKHGTGHKRAKPSLVFSAAELGAMTFPDIKWIVPMFLPEGCSILAGRPKLGKSWLALDMALAVARGSYCLGDIECPKGDVLYLALEDNPRRLKSRVDKVSPPKCDDKWPHDLDFATEWPRCEEGGLDAMRDWLESKANPRLIIIDVLAQFRSARGGNEAPYEADYRAVKAVQELASEYNIAVVIVHHVRKGMGDADPFERVSGTMGLTGAADTTIILDRDSNGCTLYARGRDLEEYERACTFDRTTCRWTVQGEASEVRRTDERSVILATLADNREPMTPSDLADVLGLPRNNVKQLLFKMAKAGEVIKANKKGQYVHPDHAGYSGSPRDTDNRDNHDNRNGYLGATSTPSNRDNHDNHEDDEDGGD